MFSRDCVTSGNAAELRPLRVVGRRLVCVVTPFTDRREVIVIVGPAALQCCHVVQVPSVLWTEFAGAFVALAVAFREDDCALASGTGRRLSCLNAFVME
jgi:hypothetical protein